MFQSDLLGKDECDFVFKKKKEKLASLRRAPGEVRPVDTHVYGAWRGRTTMGDSLTINTKQTSFHSNGAILVKMRFLLLKYKSDKRPENRGQLFTLFSTSVLRKKGVKVHHVL